MKNILILFIISFASVSSFSQNSSQNEFLKQKFPEIDEPARFNQLKPTEGKIKMVLDTDTYNEVDDQFALAYALLSKEKIDVEAIYAAPFFNSRSKNPADGMEQSYEEILRLLKMLKISPDKFVFRGSTDYLKNMSTPIKSEAVLDLIERAKRATPQSPLYVVSIGCITNIAVAILLEPDIIKNIVVVWLGGNGMDWPSQHEFNLVQDILAGQTVLNSGVPLVITPCKPVVSHFISTLPELSHYLKGKNELCNFLYERVAEYNDKNSEAWSKEIWDVVAIAWLVNPGWVKTDIIHSPVLTDQATYSIDQSRHFIRMAKTINRDAIFRDLFLKLSNF